LVSRFRELLESDAGFARSRVLTMALALPPSRDAETFFASLESRLRRLPEVAAVGAVAWLPLADRAVATSVSVTGRPTPLPGEASTADVGVATPGYFAAMGIPLRGRADGLVVSDSLARMLQVNIGQSIVVNMRDHDQPMAITGIAGDVRHAALDQSPRPTAYYTHAEFPLPAMTLVMRAKPDAAVLGLPSAAIARVRELDAAQPVRSVRWMDEWVSRSVAEKRLTAMACSTFAALAVALALMGVYGAFARWVESRRRELGVRLALGADGADVVRLLAKQAAGVLGVGLVAGLLFTYGSGQFWGISPRPTASLFAIFAFVLLVTSAIVGPARRALQVDPLIELRQE
jgi:putative ABC transport system permease protein